MARSDAFCMGRGQLFSADLAFSALLLVFLFSLLIFVSSVATVSIERVEERFELNEVALAAMDELWKTSGNPTNWERGDFSARRIASIGLASEPGVLDKEKVGVFFSMMQNSSAYAEAKKLLGVYGRGYEFGARISDEIGALYYMGNAPSGGAPAVSLSRAAMLEGRLVKLELSVWLECSAEAGCE